MSQHRLLTAQAARLTAGAATSALASAPLIAPAAQERGEEIIDVVAASEAQAAIAQAEADGRVAGATAERGRFCAVLNSEAGQGNVPLATFLLENNPSASAEAIIAHLGKTPAAAAPAPAPAAAAPAAPAPAAITTPLAETPIIAVKPAANTGEAGASSGGGAALWDEAAKNSGPGMGAAAGEIAPGVPRTGN